MSTTQEQVTAPRVVVPKMVLVEYTTHGTEAWGGDGGDTFLGYDNVQSGTMVMEAERAEDMTPVEYRHFKILGPVPPPYDRANQIKQLLRNLIDGWDSAPHLKDDLYDSMIEKARAYIRGY